MGKKEVKTEVNESAERDTIMIPVASILTDRNVRFGLKKSRIESMKESIIEKGGVMQAIEVEPLDESEATDGKEYRAVFGHYRIAGMLAANAEGHTFRMPAVIVEPLTPVDRLKRQLSENMDRENQSPIDKALAIKTLSDMGVSKMEIRNIFATPGGRKGTKAQPASNSYVNMTLSFLELHKKIQTLIHDGEITVTDAYWLTKQPADKREIAVEKAIANRAKELEEDEADENKFLESEKKREEADAKVKEAGKALETAESEVTEAISDAKTKANKALELYQAKMAAKAEDKKQAEEAHKAAEKEAQEAQKALGKKQAELKKQQDKIDKQKTAADERAKKLADARANAAKASSANPAGKTKADAPLKVKASAAVDVKNAPNVDGIPITFPAVKKVVASLCLASGCPKVTAIGKALQECFNGRIKDDTLFHKLAVITGERAEGSKAPKKSKAA